jgi:hypothetical protein
MSKRKPRELGDILRYVYRRSVDGLGRQSEPRVWAYAGDGGMSKRKPREPGDILRYVSNVRTPPRLKPGELLCHNKVAHLTGTVGGWNGFRYFVCDGSPGHGWELCPCGWMPHFGKPALHNATRYSTPPRTTSQRNATHHTVGRKIDLKLVGWDGG